MQIHSNDHLLASTVLCSSLQILFLVLDEVAQMRSTYVATLRQGGRLGRQHATDIYMCEPEDFDPYLREEAALSVAKASLCRSQRLKCIALNFVSLMCVATACVVCLKTPSDRSACNNHCLLDTACQYVTIRLLSAIDTCIRHKRTCVLLVMYRRQCIAYFPICTASSESHLQRRPHSAHYIMRMQLWVW